jgi:hypothetical protein
MTDCAACGNPIPGQPVVDVEQVSWVGYLNADKFCDDECLSNLAERQEQARIASFYG